MEEIIARVQFSNVSWIFIVPIVLMGIDFATGIFNAWIKDQIKSTKMREGLAKKFGELCILIMGAIFVYGLAVPSIVLNFVSVYIMIMELISICENLNKLGVPIPKFIKKALNDANNKIQNHGEEENKDDIRDSKY